MKSDIHIETECDVCGTTFIKNTSLHKRCSNKCRDFYAIVTKHNITINEMKIMIKNQNNCCMICGKSFNEVLLNIDHDHKTGKVRGLLCSKCNIGLGNFRDNITLLKNAIVYLED